MAKKPHELDWGSGARYRAIDLFALMASVSTRIKGAGDIVLKERNGHPASRLRPRIRSSPELQRYFETLSSELGPMNWWPAKTQFEVIVGAILTQNTAWTNVESALKHLRREQLLTPKAMERVSQAKLARLIRSSGYFRQKAKKLKAFVHFLRERHRSNLRRMFRTPTAELREQLLNVHGIGPETADSILLYAGGHSVFVVDAYTHRILSRHGLSPEKADYENVRALFESSIPADPALYNEFHALIVNVGKNWCRKTRPRCEECPLFCHLPEDSVIRNMLERPA